MLTDPPYGIGVDTDWTVRRNDAWAKGMRPIIGDDKPFDPDILLAFNHIITWGGNHYANRLPNSPDWLIWDKRRGASITRGWNAPDVEMAWTNIGCGARIFVYLWEGYKRDGEIGEHYHPTQKPVALMKWCIGLVLKSDLILDPFAGSCTTGVAAKQLGRKAILIELEEKYCEIGVKRLSQEELFKTKP